MQWAIPVVDLLRLARAAKFCNRTRLFHSLIISNLAGIYPGRIRGGFRF